jgi:hypothetical protein
MRPSTCAGAQPATGRPWARAALVTLALATVGADYPAITDRNYALDLHLGPALGSTKIVGMGGTSVAIAEGSASIAANPAAAAVRPATSSGDWDWDVYLDWLNPVFGGDFENSGLASKDDNTLVLAGGLLGQYKSWGLGLSIGYVRHVVTVPGTGERADPETAVGHVVLARSFLDQALTFGVGLRWGQFSIGLVDGDGIRTKDLFALSGGTLESGFVWRPADLDLRIGVSGAFPVSGDQPVAQGCDPTNCLGYILPNRVVVPWELAAGIAWRHGTLPWNRPVSTNWRDERELVVALDVIVTGDVSNGAGVDAFVAKQLQPSGRDVSVSPRLGAEYEILPGWMRVRAGSYWEPERTEGTSGRIHGTGGLELRLFAFHLWRWDYRMKFAVAGDVADRYGNVGLSIGFWH